MIAKRLPVVGLVFAVLVAALVISPNRGPSASTSGGTMAEESAVPAQLVPLASRAEAAASTWYCAGGSAGAGSDADQTLVVFNPGTREAIGTVQLFVEGAAPITAPVRVPPRDRIAVRLSDIGAGPHVAALVEVGTGGVVVEQEVRGVGGWDSARCSTQASDHWYFPWGRTALGSSMRLALFNPFPADAVVDVSLDTEDGYRSPESFEGMLVPARRLISVDIGAVVTRRERVSAKVVARTGRLVATELQSITGTDGSVVLDLSPGAAAAALTWYFAEGRADVDTVERLAVFNPSDDTAEVELTVLRPLAAPGAEIEPFELRVPANGYGEVVLNRESRVALPLRHTTTVQVLNGKAVVAARVVGSSTVAAAVAGTTASTAGGTTASSTPGAPNTAPATAPATNSGPGTTAPATTAASATAPPATASPATAAAAPTTAPAAGAPTTAAPAAGAATTATATLTPTTPAQPSVVQPLPPLPAGLSIALGSPVVARRWLVTSAGRNDTPGARLVVFNPSDTEEVSLSVAAVADGRPIEQAAPSSIAPRRRVDIELPLGVGLVASSLTIDTGGPVVVEVFQAYAPVPDISAEPGVPGPDTAEVPRPLG